MVRLNITKKDTSKKIRASSDTITRCREIDLFRQEIMNTIKPDIVIAETPSGSQSSAAMKGYGISCYLIGSITPSPIEVTPNEVKMASVGVKTASKDDMIEWAMNKHPEADWFYHGNKPVKGKNEHVADAIATIYAGMKTPDFNRIINLIHK